mmetsp:Transcript_38022/g.90331  ORF Transcript_38022/g.90331 Transcript_38022/m.90331 type:complete len:226 (-) Transcript_38022:569-1246(-)
MRRPRRSDSSPAACPRAGGRPLRASGGSGPWGRRVRSRSPPAARRACRPLRPRARPPSRLERRDQAAQQVFRGELSRICARDEAVALPQARAHRAERIAHPLALAPGVCEVPLPRRGLALCLGEPPARLPQLLLQPLVLCRERGSPSLGLLEGGPRLARRLRLPVKPIPEVLDLAGARLEPALKLFNSAQHLSRDAEDVLRLCLKIPYTLFQAFLLVPKFVNSFA